MPTDSGPGQEMAGVLDDSGKRCLAEVRADESVCIDHVLFGTLKDMCAELGIAEGTRVRCRRATRSVLVLETPSGRTVILDQDWARFVEVRSLT